MKRGNVRSDVRSHCKPRESRISKVPVFGIGHLEKNREADIFAASQISGYHHSGSKDLSAGARYSVRTSPRQVDITANTNQKERS